MCKFACYIVCLTGLCVLWLLGFGCVACLVVALSVLLIVLLDFGLFLFWFRWFCDCGLVVCLLVGW